MKAVKTNILLLLAIGIFNGSCAQELKSTKKPIASVDIASLYTPATIIAAAQQMPEEFYSFRPTPELRSFGELMAHIAESNFQMVAIAKGEVNPMSKVLPAKKDVIEAIQKSFDYSAEARKNMTTEQKEKMVKFMGGDQSAGNIIDFSRFPFLTTFWYCNYLYEIKGISSTIFPGRKSRKCSSETIT